MSERKLASVIEAILFAAGDPVPLQRLQSGAACSPEELEAALTELEGFYRYERRGIRLVRVGDTAQLATAPEYADAIREALEMRRAPALSQPSLEVLAIIAANQPTTRAYIEQVRGVDSSYTVGVLMDKGIVEEAGRLDVPGRPMLLRTTPEFLRIFGVSSYEELSELPEIMALRAEAPRDEEKDVDAPGEGAEPSSPEEREPGQDARDTDAQSAEARDPDGGDTP